MLNLSRCSLQLLRKQVGGYPECFSVQINILKWNWTLSFVQNWSSSPALLTPQPSLFSAEGECLQETRRRSGRTFLWLSGGICREKEWLLHIASLEQKDYGKQGAWGESEKCREVASRWGTPLAEA